MIQMCLDRLKPEQEQHDLFTKLADSKAQWTQDEIIRMHRYLQSSIKAEQNVSFALMLLRLVVLKQATDAESSDAKEERSQSTQLVANLLFEEKIKSVASRSMAWCVLSNAMGSTRPPDWNVSAGTDTYKFIQVIDRALSDSDSSKDGASTPSNVSLRQSAAAFLYNSSRYLTTGDGTADNESGETGNELSEGMMSILLGCLEHLHEEDDVTTAQRLYMATGQLLKSARFGGTAADLVRDLGLFDEEIRNGKNKDVEGLAKEVASLLE